MVSKNRDIREFRHDYKNNLISIHSFLSSGKTDEALKYNSPAYKSVLKPLNRDAFMETIKNDNDFEKTVKKYTRPNIVVRTIKFVKKIVKGMLIRCLQTKHY